MDGAVEAAVEDLELRIDDTVYRCRHAVEGSASLSEAAPVQVVRAIGAEVRAIGLIPRIADHVGGEIRSSLDSLTRRRRGDGNRLCAGGGRSCEKQRHRGNDDEAAVIHLRSSKGVSAADGSRK